MDPRDLRDGGNCPSRALVSQKAVVKDHLAATFEAFAAEATIMARLATHVATMLVERGVGAEQGPAVPNWLGQTEDGSRGAIYLGWQVCPNRRVLSMPRRRSSG